MSDDEQKVRELAYQLWDEAGRPEGESEIFWFAAKRKLAGEDGETELPSRDEPQIVAVQRGGPVGMPAERLAEPAVPEDRMADEVASGRPPARKAR